ncbi:hypothetical protein Q7P37_000162 [Cladosporium fusiforme]
MAPSTFASAAAGSNQQNNQQRDAGSEWCVVPSISCPHRPVLAAPLPCSSAHNSSPPDCPANTIPSRARRPNGATQTFRRTSNAVTSPATTQQNTENIPLAAAASSQPPRYVPPHRNGTVTDPRYSKNQLLDLYRLQQSVDDGIPEDLQSLYIGGWQPNAANGVPAAGWGRPDASREQPPGPDVCWDDDGHFEPLSLTEMDDEEREHFTTSVNTPLKPPTQTKDNQQANGVLGRKMSVNSPGGFALQSPNARGPSRRQTGESYPFPNSVASPAGRDDQRAPSPPPSLLRRRTDLKDPIKPEDVGEEKGSTTPSGSVKRNPIGPLGGAGFGVPTSPWTQGPQSAGFSPMGSFGNFGLGGSSQGTPGDKRAGLGSGRAESRFKNLLSKDSNEDIGGKSLESKGSVSNLPKVNENESWRPADRSEGAAAPLEEADEDDGLPTGSAALAAGSDLSPPNARQGMRGFDTPSRSNTRDDFGFGAFGMTSDNAGGFGSGFLQSTQQTPGRLQGGNDPASPTDTNPYKSPEQHAGEQIREGLEQDTPDIPSAPLPGLGFGGDNMHQSGGLGGLGAALPNLGRHVGSQGPVNDDRSQTSSTGPNRGFTGLGGLGQFGGAWPTSQPGLGTPGRQAAGLSGAFGGGMLGNSLGEMQSPSLAGLGGTGTMSPHNAGFGGSRMSSMFPQGMQDQMRQGEQGEDRSSQGQFAGLGGMEGDNPFHGQGFGGQLEGDQKSLEFLQDQLASQGQLPGSSASNQPPPPQQRTMVMPDRMRWIYRDPQGQTQGPWSGLEMHDWYKAGFFSPELLVKKAEDADYEPLAQLIRRIGNSREPFLVPQIGIPHGQTAASPPGPWAAAAPPAAAPPTGAQPPFASSFPSFGTTLTADQQNALERRKQEEQYLMARQKEHLAQAQIAHRMQHIPGPHPGFAPGGSTAGQLHRHPSAQSLHSQPSFGSITSPGAFQSSPNQAPASGQPAGFFDNSFRNPQGGLGAVGAGIDSLGHITEEEIPNIMNRLNLGGRAGQPNQFGAPGQPFSQQPQTQQQQQQDAHAQQVQQMLQDRARLNEEQARQDATEQDQAGQPASNERLQEFQKLQDQAVQYGNNQQANEQTSQAESSTTESNIGSPVAAQAEQVQTKEPLTLTEQVQKAASAKQSPAPQQAWAKVDTGIPQPFPPAPSQSPLPAPAAQRTSRQSVAEHLNAESRSRSQTPSTETPTTVAPWAKEPAGPPKGPSLKEIQEAEAKKAAEQEELAAAARRAALQKELEAQTAAASAAPAPGLPSSSTWAATSASPVSSGASAWAKAAQPKPAATAAKSMAQIQKEEGGSQETPAGGKSYANLAGKVMPVPAQAPTAPGGSAWTTVGAGGKTKLPAAPSPAPAARTPSASIIPAAQPSVAAAVKKAPSRSATMTGSGAVNAQEEFRKWAINELRPDLNQGLSAEQFVADLIFLPADSELITEAVHGSSSTIDSRHFAEEFIRRKRLADKGLVDTSTPPKSGSPANAGGSTGGWSEVAKKGPAKPETPKDDAANGNFRVVAAKKKGGKK